MKYASVNGERLEAQPNLSGKCTCCDSSVIARCGTVKIWHWAHKGKRKCDPWWENETPWHRAWKGQFPKEWQEVIQFAEDGEKHIADVKTDQAWVVEFQHSFIKQEERQSRESFYKKMIWIVDGTRRLRDKSKFINAWQYSSKIDGRTELRKLHSSAGRCALLPDWESSNVPVFFDFGEELLLGLLSKNKEGVIYGCSVERNKLITSLCHASQIKSLEALLKKWTNLIVNEERYLRWKANGRPTLRRNFLIRHL